MNRNSVNRNINSDQLTEIKQFIFNINKQVCNLTKAVIDVADNVDSIMNGDKVDNMILIEGEEQYPISIAHVKDNKYKFTIDNNLFSKISFIDYTEEEAETHPTYVSHADIKVALFTKGETDEEDTYKYLTASDIEIDNTDDTFEIVDATESDDIVTITINKKKPINP